MHNQPMNPFFDADSPVETLRICSEVLELLGDSMVIFGQEGVTPKVANGVSTVLDGVVQALRFESKHGVNLRKSSETAV